MVVFTLTQKIDGHSILALEQVWYPMTVFFSIEKVLHMHSSAPNLTDKDPCNS